MLEPAGDADRIMLYEIYADTSAFDAHKMSEHYARFDSESADMVASKNVVQCALVCEGSS